MRDVLHHGRDRRRTSSWIAAITALTAGAVAAMSADRLLAADPVPVTIARDEAFVVRLTRPVPLAAFEKGTCFATYGGSGNERARGTFVSGRPLIDPVTGRQVVV